MRSIKNKFMQSFHYKPSIWEMLNLFWKTLLVSLVANELIFDKGD